MKVAAGAVVVTCLLLLWPGGTAAQAPEVSAPRLEAPEIAVDGELTEPAWNDAAVLSDFTQFSPAEGAPASERTEVLVFYTPEALYVGVRAHASNPSRIRATLAERDKINADDYVLLLLDTFNDQRRAYAFYVNPLGIQQDGIYNESAGESGGGRTDFKPDYLYQSRGRLTGDGYAAEIRIPFKSLKFASGDSQTWRINVLRRIGATGAEETWAPLSRDNPSRLAQSGALLGLRNLQPGTLAEVNPTATGKREGARRDGEFRRGGFETDFGLNLKYGLASNVTLDATINPDFSQIEADAGQITVNERFAISFPEKRPFFLEGSELFETYEPLVYTRSIVDPAAGAKLTGKTGPYSFGYLGAADQSPRTGATFTYSPSPGQAWFNLARLQRDIGSGSSVGGLLTDRETGDEFNRVGSIDSRIRFAGIYEWQLQAAGSWTRIWTPDSEGRDTATISGQPVAVTAREFTGHLARVALDRTGRRWGFLVQARDVPDEFRAGSGFLRRTGVTDLFLASRVSFFGRQGALLEESKLFFSGNRIYEERDFWQGEDANEGSASTRLEFDLRGNNRVELSYFNRFFVLDPERYRRFTYLDEAGSERTGVDATGPIREMNGLDGVGLELRSSYFKTVTAELEVGWEETPIFAEGTRGTQWSTEGEVEMRPTEALRVDGSIRQVRIHREDGSLYSRAILPRLRVEYQLSRSMFLRAVGQYSLEEVDTLRTPAGIPYRWDGGPLRIRGGRISPADAPQRNPLRLDLLFSYQPSPGTVVFAGYTREMVDQEAFRFAPLEPRADGLFVKLSYLFRK